MTTLRLVRLTAGSLVIVSASLWTSAAGQEITQVTPDNGSITAGTNLANQKAIFTVLSQSMQSTTRQIFVSCSGQVTSCTTASFKTFVYATPDTVTFSTTGAGTGGIVLTAQGSISSDQGSYVVTVRAPYGVAVTPDGGTEPTRQENTGGYSASFDVQNTGTSTDTFALTCVGSANITCGVVSPAGPLALAGQTAPQNVTVNYTTGSVGTGLLKLRAASAHSSDSGSYNVPIILRAAAVRAELTERQQSTLTRISHRFFVKNLQPQTKTYNLSVVCSGTASTCQVSPASLSLAFGESQVATVTDTAATAGTGTVMLRAVDASVSNLRDSGSVALTSVTPPAPVVSLVSTNPGTAVERDMCLTIAAGQNAAFECGDLRIVHALPAIRTVNKARVPTLIYNSAYAQLYPVFTAQVTVNTVPDSVEAILKVGGVEQTRARWAGSDWVAGGTRQIALSYSPPDTAATSVRDYTIDVATIYLPSGYYLTSTASKFILVNRAKSAFGGGWWLAGLEQLVLLADSNRLWIGGDGSARLYTTAGTNVWVASNLDRPDTLIRTGSRYSRRLPGGVFVGFNAAGLHDSTVNRLGHRTGFGYDTVSQVVRLRTIALPSQGGGQTYTFNYDANNKLSSVAAPGSRTATVFVSAERVDSIRDADNKATKFSYENSSSKRISSRTDRRGTVTSYSYDAAEKLSRVQVNLQPDSIRTGFSTRELLGLATATPKTATDTPNVYTSFFGARNYATGSGYIAQETKLWLDRYGAPRKIVNPLGYQTVVKREEGQWSTLATEQQAPNGFVTRGRYDGRGNIAASIALAPYGGSDATTRYHWDQKWDLVDSIISATGVTTTFAYDTTNGNRLWQQLGPDQLRLVQFRYGNSLNLLSSTLMPNAGSPYNSADSLEYDAMGNISVVRTPKMFDTHHTYDAIGRDTLVQVRLDTLTGTPTYQTTVTCYDVLDRDTMQISAGPPWNGAAAETLYVRKYYNTAGQLDSLSRWPRPAVTPVGTLTTRWKYDAAGRVVAEIAPDLLPDSMFYDAAGDDTLHVTRRHDRVAMVYDVLNRLSIRRLPADSYAVRSSSLQNSLTPRLPTSYAAYVIAPDTQTFTYDSLGNIRTARNGDARVTRTYYMNGSLNKDSLVIRTVQGWDSTKHAYRISHVYDLDGRETQLNIPTQLVGSGQTAAFYTYDSQLGLLTSVTDLDDSVYHFTYTPRGEIATRQFPTGFVERYGYDADGRIMADTVLNPNDANYSVCPPAGGQACVIRSIGFRYDAANRLVKTADPLAFKDTLNLSYSGLGHLITSNLAQHVILVSECGVSTTEYSVNESFTYDALGNRAHAYTTETWSGSGCPSSSFTNHGSGYDATGRLTSDTLTQGVTSYYHNNAGDIEFSQNLGGPPSTEQASYYGPDEHVRATDSRTDYGHFNSWTRAFDEYRYDALGRRIWVRSRKTCADDGNSPFPFGGECQTSLLRRTIWDGDQILAEIQMPGGDTTRDTTYWENDTAAVSFSYFQSGGRDQDPSRYYGRVVYAHADRMDQPVAVTRFNYVHALDDNLGHLSPPMEIARATIMPFWNVLGDAPLGAFNTGDYRVCATPTTNCEGVAWPFKFSAYDRRSGLLSDNWQGSLLEDGQDKSGLQFRRNRLYDPQTGRFTQEDPLGLAGGLNLYGFAGGDPVNFSDPFGLCPPKKLSEVLYCAGQMAEPAMRIARVMWTAETLVLPMGEGGALTTLSLGGRAAQGGTAAARALGEAGEVAAGIVRNTERIPSATGTAAFRVPDALTATTLTEVKNVARLSLTNQLRDFAAFAKATGRAFDLVIRNTTELTRPLQEFIRTEGINVRFLP